MEITINGQTVQHFCSGFDHANLVSSFRGFKYLPKLDSVMHIFYNISTQNVLFEKMIIFLSTSGRFGIRHIFRTGGDMCLL